MGRKLVLKHEVTPGQMAGLAWLIKHLWCKRGYAGNGSADLIAGSFWGQCIGLSHAKKILHFGDLSFLINFITNPFIFKMYFRIYCVFLMSYFSMGHILNVFSSFVAEEARFVLCCVLFCFVFEVCTCWTSGCCSIKVSWHSKPIDTIFAHNQMRCMIAFYQASS